MARQQFSFSDHRELIGAVNQFCAEGRTGTLLAVTGTNRFLRLIIELGNVIYIEYRLKKGVAAVPLVKEIDHGTFEFAEGRIAPHVDLPLPPTSELLAQLTGDAVPTFVPSSSGLAPQRAAPVPKVDRSEAYRIIEQELIEVLGPMATFVWSEHLDNAGGPSTSADLSVLINAVCTDIDSPKRSAEFQKRVWARLR